MQLSYLLTVSWMAKLPPLTAQKRRFLGLAFGTVFWRSKIRLRAQEVPSRAGGSETYSRPHWRAVSRV